MSAFARSNVPAADAAQVDALLAAFDRALELHRQRLAFAESCKALPFYHQAEPRLHVLTVFEEHSPHAEYAMRLWATANGFEIRERMHDAHGFRFRVLYIAVDGCSLVSMHGRDEHVGVREPAPGVVIRVEPEQQPANDESSMRFSLLEID